MLLSPLTNSITTRLQLYQFTANTQKIKILHLGNLLPELKNYFSGNGINYTMLEHVSETTEIDIVLVNKKEFVELPDWAVTIRPVVNYTTSYTTNPGMDVIHFSIIPILVKYIIKIKESIDFLNKNKIDMSKHLFINNVIVCIDNHLDDHTFTMSRLCKSLCMSRSALSKKIKKLTGKKPTQFINDYKLKKSKHLLVVTNWQIATIADKLGFSSQHYYSRLFKKEEGVSPLQYRIQNKKH